jgi:hypothetical protein
MEQAPDRCGWARDSGSREDRRRAQWRPLERRTTGHRGRGLRGDRLPADDSAQDAGRRPRARVSDADVRGGPPAHQADATSGS